MSVLLIFLSRHHHLVVIGTVGQQLPSFPRITDWTAGRKEKVSSSTAGPPEHTAHLLWRQEDGQGEVGRDEGPQICLQTLSEAWKQGVSSRYNDVLVQVGLHL